MEMFIALFALASIPSVLFLVLRAHDRALQAHLQAVADMQRDMTDRLLQHLKDTYVVGGRPVDLEKRAYDIAEEKNKLEGERLALERERVRSRVAGGPPGRANHASRSPEG